MHSCVVRTNPSLYASRHAKVDCVVGLRFLGGFAIVTVSMAMISDLPRFRVPAADSFNHRTVCMG